MTSDLEPLAALCHTLAPSAGQMWATPDGYPNSLGLCILDSIWSIGINYDNHVVPVLIRYRKHRVGLGADADHDSPADLAAVIVGCGGPEGFADHVATRHRTSSKNGILKADAVLRAAIVLADVGMATCADFAARNGSVKAAWRSIPGQHSGVSWKYLLMLAGVDGIKPDRMIHRFLARAGISVDDDRAVELLSMVQQQWNPTEQRPTLRQLDYAIWTYERPTKLRRSS